MPFQPNEQRGKAVWVVSGLPRSGTSLTMKMLGAAGLDLLVDHIRSSDDSNPTGYFEYEPVKSLKTGDTQWLENARGRVVKIVSPLLHYLPAGYNYKIIFMRRNLAEVMQSQTKMLRGFNKPAPPDLEAQLEKAFQDHLRQIEGWLAAQGNIQTLYLSYNQLLSDPGAVIPFLAEFLAVPVNTQAMLAAIDPGLYRNRLEKPAIATVKPGLAS